MKKERKQPERELPGMPDRTPAGKKAVEFVELLKQRDDTAEAIDKTGKELVELMRAENKSQIKIFGLTLSPKLIESKIKIQVKKEAA